MNLGPQFEQPELPGMPAPDTKGPARRSLDYKQQQKEAGVGMTRGYSDNKINKFAESPMESRTPTESFHKRGDQLKMFMTPREIEHEWQPLDADRDDAYNYTSGTSDTRAGEQTGRNARTDDVPNIYLGRQTKTGAKTDSRGYKAQKMVFKRPSSTSPNDYEGGTETDEQLWDRKYEEATEYGVHGQHSWDRRPEYVNSQGKTTQNSFKHVVRIGDTRPKVYNEGSDRTIGWRDTEGNVDYYNSRHRSSSWQPREEKSEGASSLAESIEREGVKSPIRLGLNYGENAKPQLAGGHHRMAVARIHAPDQFAPVLYHSDIHEARSFNTKRSYPYT